MAVRLEPFKPVNRERRRDKRRCYCGRFLNKDDRLRLEIFGMGHFISHKCPREV